MSLRKRLIACLDVTGGRVVKGTRFVDLVDAGEPIELAERYAREGADEIVILDIGATRDGRPALLGLISRAATALDVPLAVGGADKVGINTAALADPALISRIADRLGSQSVVVAIDALRGAETWKVRSVAGTRDEDREAVAWAREAVERGAGEILLTSIDRDGTRAGYDLELTRAVADAVPVPVIASGGAGTAHDIVAALTVGRASAALLASLLHFGIVRLPELKAALSAAGVSIRPPATPPSPEEVAAWLA